MSAELLPSAVRGNMQGKHWLPMNSAKDQVRKLLDRLPEEASFEDIRYQVYVLVAISRGSEEIDRGDSVEHEEVTRRLTKRLEK